MDNMPVEIVCEKIKNEFINYITTTLKETGLHPVLILQIFENVLTTIKADTYFSIIQQNAISSTPPANPSDTSDEFQTIDIDASGLTNDNA